MDYKIIDIEGVGDVYAEKLTAAGINKVSELLEKCAAPKGRQELAEATGISEKLVGEDWRRHRQGVPSPCGREPAAEAGGSQCRVQDLWPCARRL